MEQDDGWLRGLNLIVFYAMDSHGGKRIPVSTLVREVEAIMGDPEKYGIRISGESEYTHLFNSECVGVFGLEEAVEIVIQHGERERIFETGREEGERYIQVARGRKIVFIKPSKN